MPTLLWSKQIWGNVVYADAQSLITAPGGCDSYCFGGRWSRYCLKDGEVIWHRYHFRGGNYFSLVSDVIVATTPGGGIYGISFIDGRKLWTRLGDAFDWLLRLLDWIPELENEGDYPLGVVQGQILSRSGRMIDCHTGRIVSRHRLETYVENIENKHYAVGFRGTIDGQTVDFPPRLLQHKAEYENYVKLRDETGSILRPEGLVISSAEGCIHVNNSNVFVVGCEPPDFCRMTYMSRVAHGVKAINVRHWLIVFRTIDGVIVHREDLGDQYVANLSSPCQGLLAVELQTRQQLGWTNRCDLRVYDISRD